ncbi:class I SAM-dependent methyltransferase [bacterium]|nr:class I SAM-dependent methyltransferase [bacterium]
MLSREITTKIAFILDELIPPVLRDSKWFMWIPFKLLFGRKTTEFFRFKEHAFDMSFDQFKKTYESLESVHIQRETDLNRSCISAILRNIEGGNVLEVGCGRAHLAKKINERVQVVACDMVISPEMRLKNPEIDFRAVNVEGLPFIDSEFDTVVCTHTLEHVLDIERAISELRRVAKKRLIIVVPKQRPYKYTFDLHIHFFPYKWSLLAYMQQSEKTDSRSVRLIEGDWYYQEEIG